MKTVEDGIPSPEAGEGAYIEGSLLEMKSLLARIKLTVGQAAELIGVTPRQLAYWTEKGIIKARRQKGHAQVYDLEAIRKALVIRRLMDQGLTLGRAVEEAEAIMARVPELRFVEPSWDDVLKDGNSDYGVEVQGSLEKPEIRELREEFMRHFSSLDARLRALEERENPKRP